MLPTPDTTHVPYSRVYEPAEDSFLLLDTLSSPSEISFLSSHFPPSSSPPLLTLEIGPGSGVVLAFLTAHSAAIFSSPVLTLGIDINRFACKSTTKTVHLATTTTKTTSGAGHFLAAIQGDLHAPLRNNRVDVLVFNPPYVPTEEMPCLPEISQDKTTFEQDSALLALSYAGGKDGMETTNKVIDSLPDLLSERGVAYILLCAGNKPDEVKRKIRDGLGGVGGGVWSAETVGTSGKQAGWEKLQIVRIWRE